MKYGPFPLWPAFPTSEYYDPLRLPLDHPRHFPGSPVIGRASLPASPQPAGPRRLSRVPRTTIRTFNAQYAGGFIGARLTTLTRASLTLQTARSLTPRFAPGLSATHGGFTTGDPGISPDRTRTGRPP